MSSQSEDVTCDEIVALENTFKCNRFMFNVTLDISYYAIRKWENDLHLWQTILITITYQIGHKYKNWQKYCNIIADRLLNKLMTLKASSIEWNGQITVRGYYYDEESDSNYSEIILDCFCSNRLMSISIYSDVINQYEEILPVCLQYNIRFILLIPALSPDLFYYCSKKYEKICYPLIYEWDKYENIINTELDRNEEYNHNQVWTAAYNAYNPSE
ncbi:hypothetical protein PV326_007614 [Microctonus aethiopoides]|nr:hypothetical protein PV326_007614 [Microctonus aethiopoides]